MIRHVFFDLDHTLWDFDGNAAHTLRALHAAYELARHFPAEAFVAEYTRVNHRAWHRFHQGEISQAELRRSRFPDTFLALGVAAAACPPELGERFIQDCSGQAGTLPYAHEVLTELQRRGYALHIITNGFHDSQHRKLAASDLARYFGEVVTTDCTGCSKPDAAMFRYALTLAGATAEESMMVGDSLEADVLGAQRAGLAAVYYNPDRAPHPLTLEHEISSLKELLEIL